MYERILFPTDGGETASSVFDHALEIASTHGATIHVLNVADTTKDSVVRIEGTVIDALERHGERVVGELADRARDRDVPVVTDVLQGVPYETIVEYGERYDIDLLVMPTYGREGVERFLLGSVTERVVNSSTTPVLTVPPDLGDAFTYPPRNVAVPTDGSPGAQRATDVGVALAKATDATLHFVHVVETASLGVDVRSAADREKLEERAEALLEAATESATAASVSDVVTAIEYGRPYREILSYVDDNDVDVVALGTQGETSFSRYVLGGVSAKLVRTAPVPVVFAREPDSD